MRTERIEIHIASSPGGVWEVMQDVERWPEWTPSIRKVAPQGPAKLDLGHRFRISQPRLQPMVWTVTRLQPGTSFSWQTRMPGVVLTARHEIASENAGSRVRLGLEFAGCLGDVVAWLTRNINRRYLRMEAEGLKARCERGCDGLQRPAHAKTAHRA